MRAFIQKVNGEFSNVNFYSSAEGFRELGYEIIYFEHLPLSDRDKRLRYVPMIPAKSIVKESEKFVHPSMEDVIVAGVPVVAEMLKFWDVDYKPLESYPKELYHLTRGLPEIRTIKYVRDRVMEGRPTFMKPLDEDRKLFNGNLAKKFRDLTYTSSLPADFKVWAADPVEILTEYRVFIHRGEIKGCKHYRGDFFKALDKQSVLKAISEFHSAPVAYALDMGVDGDGHTFLVEASDATSLGMYGFFPPFYAAMIADRWKQLVGLPYD